MLNPPYLVVRPGQSFWVETRSPEDCTATLQAFQDGCYTGAWCYDAMGGQWPVVEARLKTRPSFLDRVMPGRRVPVELRIGPRAEVDMADALRRIREVLNSDNEFCEYLNSRTPVTEVLAQFEGARTTADLIAVANRLE
jgi:hypothetical protein